MEKAGEGVSGHGGRGGEGLGDGVLGLIWSGFLLSGSRYILHFCLRSFFSFTLQRVFCIFGVGVGGIPGVCIFLVLSCVCLSFTSGFSYVLLWL